MGDFRTPNGLRIMQESGPLGLALSGDGLKASLFHIGVLARLAELDLLRRIDVISATGGGAAIAALYHLHLKRALDAEGDINTHHLVRMVAAVEQDFLAAAQTDLRAGLAENVLSNLKRLSSHHSDSARLGDLLERRLFRSAWNGDPDWPIQMREIAIHPRGDRDFNPITDNRKRYCRVPSLVINAANLDTGRAWRFDAERMGEPTASPAARRLSKAPLLAESPYRRLPEAYAGMTLGHAVAAAMATPGLLEPLHLHRLYPDPERPANCLTVRLAGGSMADPLAADALVDRGCRRLIVSDASGFERTEDGSSDRARAVQLDGLERRCPNGVVLINLLSEIESIEVRPLGPIAQGQVVTDRHDDDATSYGVQRRLQKLIAGMRAGLEAPTEIEAMSLMADGYLIAKRAFDRLRQRGETWGQGLPHDGERWRFAPLSEALGQPSKKHARHLKTARLSAFKAPRLAMSQALGLGLLIVAGALTLIALGAFWSAIRPAAGADRIWILASLGLLMAVSWLAGRHLGEGSPRRPTTGLIGAAAGWIDKVQTMVMAIPRFIRARFQRRASRAVLRAGELKRVGIEPVPAEKPVKEPVRRREPAARPTRKAA